MLPELETERLFMREVKIEDGPALKAFQNSPEQWEHQAVEPKEFADGTLRVHRYMEHRGSDPQRFLYVYVAFEKQTGILIGQASLTRSHPAIASIGFGIARQRFKNGFGIEMASRIIQFGFEQIKLNRISADVAVENKACIATLNNLGMLKEGVSRQCIWAQGKWWDEVQFSILGKEYLADS